MSAKQVEKILQGPAGYAVVVVVGGIVLYLIGSKLISSFTGNKTPGSGGVGYTGGAVGAALGTSDLQTSTNLDGSQQTAYQGHGALGTLGATFNNLSGGLFSSLGETLGGWAADASESLSNTSSGTSTGTTPATSQKSAVQDNWWAGWSDGVQGIFTP